MSCPKEGRVSEVRALLFDKDGTLVDSLGPWAEAEGRACRMLLGRVLSPGMAPRLLDRLEEEALAAIGVREGRVDPRGLLAAGDTRSILEGLRRALLPHGQGAFGDPEAFRREFESTLKSLYPGGSPPVKPMPGAEGALEELSALGLPLGLATSDDRALTLAELDALGWRRFFSFFAFGDETPAGKPDPWAALEFARVRGLDIASVAVVGDSAADAAMAKTAGALLFVRVLDSLAELPALLRGEAPAGAGPELQWLR